MADPLDYEPPFHDADDESGLTDEASAAVPVEFDTKLTDSQDMAAVAAVESVLRAAGIDFVHTDDGKVAGRTVVLFVRGEEFAQAGELAAEVFARRARVKKLNPRQPPPGPDDFPWTRAVDI